MAEVRCNGAEHRVENIFCIGRNYAAHAAELGHTVEEEPMVFCKPTSSVLCAREGAQPAAQIVLPDWSQSVHFECELVLLVGQGGRNISADAALSHIAGIGIGLDLTARDVQTVCKQKGQPWLRAKGFPHAACVSDFVPFERVTDHAALRFSLAVNGDVRQRGDSRLMVFSLPVLVSELSRVYGLSAGDLIFTGTPEGVGALHSGDVLQLTLDGLTAATFTVA